MQWSEMFSDTVYLFKFHFNFRQYVLTNYLLPLQQVQQQVNLLQVATQDGLLMDIVMVSITTWTATMMVETVVDVMSAHNTVALHATALIPMEAGVEQLAHKQQHQFQPQQALLFLDPLVSQLSIFSIIIKSF